MLRQVFKGDFPRDRIECGNPELQRAVDESQLISWMHSLGPWDVIAHLTWRDKRCWYKDGSDKFVGVSEWSAARGVERFMNALPGVSYFYSVEKNPSREGHHSHMLWGDCRGLFRSEQWARWVKLHGRARIEPVRSEEDVAGYASKYVLKRPCWWNVKIRWHRMQALHKTPWTLSA